MDATLLVAFQVLPALSVFITGFASVRAHAYRDRAFVRADGIETGIRRVVENEGRHTDLAIRDLAREHERSLGTKPSIADAIMVNLIVFVAVLALEILAASRMGWKFTAASEPSLAFLGFCAILLTPIAMLVITGLDTRRIGKDLFTKRVATLWGKAATAQCHFEANRLEQARSLADEVIRDTSGRAWAARLRARVELARYPRGDPTADPRALDGVIAMLSMAMDLKAMESTVKSPAAELKLRARAFEFQEELDSAVRDIAEALIEDPEDPELWLQRGHLYERLAESEMSPEAAASRYEVSRMSYVRASELDIVGAAPLIAAAELELRTGHPDRAVILAEHAHDREPRNQAIENILDKARNVSA